MKWAEVISKPDFQDLGPTDQAYVRQSWWDHFVGPDLQSKGIPDDEIQAIRQTSLTEFDNGQGYISSFLGATAQGALGTISSGIQGLGALTATPGIEDIGTSMQSGIENTFTVNPSMTKTNFVGNVVGNVGAMIGTGAVGGIAGRALGATRLLEGATAAQRAAAALAESSSATFGAEVGSLGSGFFAGAGQGAQEADQYGITGGDRQLRAFLGGAAEVVSEKLPFGQGLELKAISKVPGVGKLATGKAGSFFGDALKEGGEEIFSQGVGNISTNLLAPTGVQGPDITKDMVSSFIGGAIGGGLMGGINLIPASERGAKLAEEAGDPAAAEILRNKGKTELIIPQEITITPEGDNSPNQNLDATKPSSPNTYTPTPPTDAEIAAAVAAGVPASALPAPTELPAAGLSAPTGLPAAGLPAAEAPAVGLPATETPLDGTPSTAGVPATGALPAVEVPVAGATPTTELPAAGITAPPVAEAPATGAPVAAAPPLAGAPTVGTQEFGLTWANGKPSGDILEGKELIGEGSESVVYGDGNSVLKISEPYSDNSEDTYQSRIARPLEIDALIGDGTLTVEGFYRSKNGTKNPIFRQHRISGRPATRAEIRTYLESRGFTMAEEGTATDTFTKQVNGEIVTVSDLDGENVIIDANGPHVIDADVVKTAAPTGTDSMAAPPAAGMAVPPVAGVEAPTTPTPPAVTAKQAEDTLPTPPATPEQLRQERQLIDQNDRVNEQTAKQMVQALRDLGALGDLEVVFNDTGKPEGSRNPFQTRGGRYKVNGKEVVYLNRNLLMRDTPVHESLGHGIIEQLDKLNPELEAQARAILIGSPLEAAIKERYAREGVELDSEALFREAKATLIGNQGAKVFSDYASSGDFVRALKQWVAKFQTWLDNHLASKGVDPNMSLEDFAKKVNRLVIAGKLQATTSTTKFSESLLQSLPQQAQAAWTAGELAAADKYSESGNRADLAGLNPVKVKRVMEHKRNLAEPNGPQFSLAPTTVSNTPVSPTAPIKESVSDARYSIQPSGLAANQPGTKMHAMAAAYNVEGENGADATRQAEKLYDEGGTFEQQLAKLNELFVTSGTNGLYNMTPGAYFGMMARDLTVTRDNPEMSEEERAWAERNLEKLMELVTPWATSGGQRVKGIDLGLKVANSPAMQVRMDEKRMPFDGNPEKRKEFDKEKGTISADLGTMTQDALSNAPEEPIVNELNKGLADQMRGEDTAATGAVYLEDAEKQINADEMPDWFTRAMNQQDVAVRTMTEKLLDVYYAIDLINSEGDFSLPEGRNAANATRDRALKIVADAKAAGKSKTAILTELQKEAKDLLKKLNTPPKAVTATKPASEDDVTAMAVDRAVKLLTQLTSVAAKPKQASVNKLIAKAVTDSIFAKVGLIPPPAGTADSMATTIGLLLANQNIAASLVQDTMNRIALDPAIAGLITMPKLKAFFQATIGKEFTTAEGTTESAAPYGQKQIADLLRAELRTAEANLNKIAMDAALERKTADQLEAQLRDPKRSFAKILDPVALNEMVTAVRAEFEKTARDRAIEIQKKNDQRESDQALRDAAKDSREKRKANYRQQKNQREVTIKKLNAEIRQMTPGAPRTAKEAQRDALMTTEEIEARVEREQVARDKEDEAREMREAARESKDKRKAVFKAEKNKRENTIKRLDAEIRQMTPGAPRTAKEAQRDALLTQQELDDRAERQQAAQDKADEAANLREAARESRKKRKNEYKQQKLQRENTIKRLDAEIRQMTPGAPRTAKEAQRDALLTKEQIEDRVEREQAARDKADEARELREAARESKNKRQAQIDAQRRKRKEARRAIARAKGLPEPLNYEETQALMAQPGEKVISYLAREFGFDLKAITAIAREADRYASLQQMILKLADSLGLSQSQTEILMKPVIAEAMKTVDAKRKAEVKKRIEATVRRMTGRTKKDIPTEAQKLIRLAELGGLTADNVETLLLNTLGAKKLTDETRQELIDLITRANDPNLPQTSHDSALGAYNNYVSSLRGVSALGLLGEWTMSNIFMSMNTFKVNAIWGGVKAVADSAIYIARVDPLNWNISAQLPKGARQALLRQIIRGYYSDLQYQAKYIAKTGKTKLENDYTTSPTNSLFELIHQFPETEIKAWLDGKPISPAFAKVAKQMAGFGKWTRRIMVATDIVNRTPAYEMLKVEAVIKFIRDRNTNVPTNAREWQKQIDDALYGGNFKAARDSAWQEVETAIADGRVSKEDRGIYFGEVMDNRLAETLGLNKQQLSVMLDRAQETAKRWTVANATEGILGGISNTMLAAVRDNPGLKFLLPAIRMPIGAFSQSLDWSPYGFFRYKAIKTSGFKTASFTNLIMNKSGKRNWNQPAAGIPEEQAIDVLNKAALGTGMMIAMAIAAYASFDDDEDKADFYITGKGPEDPQKNKLWRDKGNKPFMVRVKGVSANFQESPVFFALSILGAWSDAHRYGKPGDAESDKLFYAMTKSLAGFGDAAVLKSFQDTLAVATGGSGYSSSSAVDTLTKTFGRVASVTVAPRLVNEINTILYGPQDLKEGGWAARVFANVPFVPAVLDYPALNWFGEKIDTARGGVAGEIYTLAYSRVSPILTDDEQMRFVAKIGANKLTTTRRTIDGHEVMEQPELMHQWAKASGASVRRWLTPERIAYYETMRQKDVETAEKAFDKEIRQIRETELRRIPGVVF